MCRLSKRWSNARAVPRDLFRHYRDSASESRNSHAGVGADLSDSRAPVDYRGTAAPYLFSIPGVCDLGGGARADRGVLEDLHWAEEATLLLLRHLAGIYPAFEF